MFNFFKKKDADQERVQYFLQHQNQQLKHIAAWIDYFHKIELQNQQKIHDLELSQARVLQEQTKAIGAQNERLARVEATLNFVPKTREEIRALVDFHYDSSDLERQITELKTKIADLEQKRTPTSYKEKMVAKITRNSKEYLKSMLISLIKKYGRISALQLKEMMVDEQNLLSKSSFYRLLEEIEQLEDIAVMKQGKEKIYVSKEGIKAQYN
ncbi:MAG: hypothetical protein QW331_02015 [Candidatus Woesearchaeota archaeon]